MWIIYKIWLYEYFFWVSVINTVTIHDMALSNQIWSWLLCWNLHLAPGILFTALSKNPDGENPSRQPLTASHPSDFQGLTFWGGTIHHLSAIPFFLLAYTPYRRAILLRGDDDDAVLVLVDVLATNYSITQFLQFFEFRFEILQTASKYPSLKICVGSSRYAQTQTGNATFSTIFASKSRFFIPWLMKNKR